MNKFLQAGKYKFTPINITYRRKYYISAIVHSNYDKMTEIN